VRLKYGVIVECTGCEKDADGKVTAVLAKVVPDTKSGTPGADAIKVKGNITWVAAADAVPAEVRLYERLFAAAQPGAAEVQEELNPHSLVVSQAYVEPALAQAPAGSAWQFERHGYFVPDSRRAPGAGLVFNRAAGMKDSWGK
jgi:glutaminyl-tRNA synthetase